MVDDGTKYLAISRSLPASRLFERVIFRLMMPSRHFCPASNTPDPEFKEGVTSLIAVGNLLWILGPSNTGNTTWERAIASGTATMSGSAGHGRFSHSGMRRICR